MAAATISIPINFPVASFAPMIQVYYTIVIFFPIRDFHLLSYVSRAEHYLHYEYYDEYYDDMKYIATLDFLNDFYEMCREILYY